MPGRQHHERRRRRRQLLAAVVALACERAWAADLARDAPESLGGFERLGFLAPRPMGTSIYVTVDRDGTARIREIRRIGAERREKRWEMKVPPERMEVLRAAVPRCLALPTGEPRPGIPGAVYLEILLTDASGKVSRRGKWAGERLPGFDELQRAFEAMHRSSRPSG